MSSKFNYLSFIDNKKNILVCPLDWGLGHATRCVPLIHQFIAEGHQVIIGADNNPLAFLKQEFPQLKSITIPGYEVNYDEKGSSLQLLYESIQFLKFIKKEHALIDAIVAEHNIDRIVSDNRYGLWSTKIESIIITHQLYVKAPLGESFVHKKIEKLIRKFDQCWIPDVEGTPNLSGDLAHLKPFNHSHQFIGPLSRFSALRALKHERRSTLKIEAEYDIIAIISGPEPQRTVFEKLVFNQLKQAHLKAVIVRGLPSQNVTANCHPKPAKGETKAAVKREEISSQSQNDGTLKIFNHLPTEELFNYLQKSKVVVSRAGYSSIMDLATLGKKAILVPTPGQTEQEYLADYHIGKGTFYAQKQSEFDLEKAVQEMNSFYL